VGVSDRPRCGHRSQEYDSTDMSPHATSDGTLRGARVLGAAPAVVSSLELGAVPPVAAVLHLHPSALAGPIEARPRRAGSTASLGETRRARRPGPPAPAGWPVRGRAPSPGPRREW